MTDDTRIKTVYLAPSGRYRHSLRRYSSEDACKGNAAVYCNAEATLGDIDKAAKDAASTNVPHSHVLWPQCCAACGKAFKESDHWQVNFHNLYRTKDGREMTIREAPVGGYWDATWLHGQKDWCGVDGRCIVMRMPGDRDWMIDGTANNCTMPADKVHKCWCRHGSIEEETLHVDKIGNTCAAGAGSIALPNWHGFLRNGYLEKC